MDSTSMQNIQLSDRKTARKITIPATVSHKILWATEMSQLKNGLLQGYTPTRW